MQSTKETIFQFFQKPWITGLAISILFVAVVVITKFYLTDISENYQQHSQLLNSVVGGVLGLIVIITVYYLGKLHDYKKDFLKTGSKVDMSNHLLRQRLSRLKSLSKEESDKLSEISDTMLKIPELLKNLVQQHKRIVEDVFKLTKPRRDFIYLTIPFVEFGFVHLISKETEGDLYLQSSVLVFGIVILLRYWKMYEETMQTLHELYGTLLGVLTACQCYADTVEEYISSRNRSRGLT